MTATFLFLTLMIPGTFFLGLNDVFIRRVLRTGAVDERLLVTFDYLSVSLILLIPLFWFGIPYIDPSFLGAISLTILLNIFAAWAWFTAFKREEASLISPLRLLTPPLVVGTGYLLLKENPTLEGIIGILITIVGLWFLFSGEARDQRKSFREVIRKPGVILGILGATSFAFSFPLDKKAVVASSAFFTAMISFAGVALGNFLLYFIFSSKKKVLFGWRSNWKTLISMPLVHTVGSVLTFAALPYALAAYASSVKRLWSFWTVILSGQFLKEKHIGRKLLATLVMLLGIAVTVFLG